jgi:hypothetical protein
MTHGQFDQLKKLILLLDDPRNDIYVHVDAKSHDFNQDQFNNLTKKAGLFFIKRKRVTWGAFSQVNCELRLLKTATKTYHNFYHLLSGADLPIKSQDEIHNYFEENSETEFLSLHEGVMETKNYRDRIQVYHFLQGLVGNKKSDSIVFKIEWGLLKLQELLNVDRLKKTNLVFQKGTNWFSITHKLAQYVVSEAPQIRKIYKLTKCADEVFLHTLAWNSQFRDRIQSDSKRLIDWKRGRPYTFRLNDFEALMNSPCFWARKFNEAVEPEIVNKLFQTLNLNS